MSLISKIKDFFFSEKKEDTIEVKQEVESKDTIEKRMAYAMSELLRWSIEDTDWDTPLVHCMDNSKILSAELQEKKQ